MSYLSQGNTSVSVVVRVRASLAHLLQLGGAHGRIGLVIREVARRLKRLPNVKSAAKRVKTARARAIRNASTKSSVKTAVKRYEAQLAQGDPGTAEIALRRAMSALDKAAKKGVIHKNQAARRKSRLAKKLVAAVGAKDEAAAEQ